MVKFEDEDPTRLKLIEDPRHFGALFLFVGAFLCWIGSSGGQSPLWLGLASILAGFYMGSSVETEFNKEEQTTIIKTCKAFLWRDSEKIPFESIQGIKVVQESQDYRRLVLELPNLREIRLASFNGREANRVQLKICEALGQSNETSDSTPSPIKQSSLEKRARTLAVLGGTEMDLKRAIKHNLIFCFLGAIFLALLSPIFIELSGHSFLRASELRQSDSREILESSQMPLIIGGSWEPQQKSLSAVSALGFVDRVSTMNNGEVSHAYLPLHYPALLIFLFTGFVMGAYGFISGKPHLTQRGVSYFFSCFLVFGVVWIVIAGVLIYQAL